ncbi:MAG: STAS domain-containing protein [Magnetococcales bacterium]|nr:STAS domain-containing protein [Magnetococcales bacterium]MBF0322694.1 STAS domain-containing protein [Magnetococcales bacterium]
MIVVEESKEQVVLRLPAEFNFRLSNAFRECYQQRDPGLTYVIDFQDVSLFDSSALGMLLMLRNHCGEEKARIHLVNCGPFVRKILATAKFELYFSIDGGGGSGWWPGA